MMMTHKEVRSKRKLSLTEKRRRRKADCPVTVCVAAIFEDKGVVGASDRMLSAGDIDFEPDVPKIRYLTSSCGAMIAGDMNLHTEILGSVMPLILERINKNPSVWIPISDIAGIYKSQIDVAIMRRAELRVLAPFGLTRETFMSQQHMRTAEQK